MYIEYSSDDYQGNVGYKEILKVSGEVITGSNCVEITESMITAPFDEKRLVLYNTATSMIVEKTSNQLKLERLLYYQAGILNRLIPINVAISAQDATNKVLVEDSEPEVYTISKADIKAIGQYQNTVTNFHNTWTPGNYNLEDIDESIFNGGLNLPEIVTRLLS